MAEVIRNVVVKLAIEQIQAKLEAPDTKELQAAYQKVEASQDSVKEKVAETNTVIESQSSVVSENAEKHAEATEKINELNIRAADSFKQAGDGAFTLARGIAFVTASREEDYQQALKTIAAAQGLFDIYKGSVDLIKGVVEGRRALAAATALAATAEAGAATATSGYTTALVANTIATKAAVAARAALLAVTNPLVLAVVALGYGLWELWEATTEKNAAEEKAIQLEKERIALLERRKKVAAEVAVEETRFRARQSLSRLTGPGADLGSVEAEMQRNRQAFSSIPQQEQTRKAEIAFLEGQLKLLEVAKDIRREEVQQKKESLQISEQELATRQNILQSEKQRSQAIEERIGRLTELQRKRLAALAQGGVESRAEAEEIESLVGSTRATASFFRSQSGDIGQFSGAFGEEHLRRSQEIEAQLQQTQAQIENNDRAIRKVNQSWMDFVEKQDEQIRQMKSQIDKLQHGQTVQQIRRQGQ